MKRDALKKEIAVVEKALANIDIDLSSAEADKKKYLDSPISDIAKKINDAVVKGPEALKSVLTDVFNSVRFSVFLHGSVLTFCCMIGNQGC